MIVLYACSDFQYFRNLEVLPSSLPLLDRDKIIANKLQAVFPDAAIRGSVLLKDLPKSVLRREGEAYYLFAAVPYHDSLMRLFSVLRMSMMPVEGMGVSPVEATDMLCQLFDRSQLQSLSTNSVSRTVTPERFKAAQTKTSGSAKIQNWQIMIGQSEAGALRLMCVCEGMLAFNRVSTVSDIAKYPELWAEEVMHELKSLCSALPQAGFRAGDRLSVLALAAKPAQKPLIEGLGSLMKSEDEQDEDDLPYISAIDYEFIDTEIASQRLNLKLEEDSSRYVWDSLLAAWMGKKGRMKMPLRPPEVEETAKPRRAFGWFAAALVVFLAVGLQSLVDYNKAIDATQVRLDQLTLRLSDLKSNLEQSRQALAAFGEGNIEVLTYKKKIIDAVEEGQGRQVERISIAVETAKPTVNVKLKSFHIRKKDMNHYETVLSVLAADSESAELALKEYRELLSKAFPGWSVDGGLALETSANVVSKAEKSGVLDSNYDGSSIANTMLNSYRLSLLLKSEVS